VCSLRFCKEVWSKWREGLAVYHSTMPHRTTVSANASRRTVNFSRIVHLAHASSPHEYERAGPDCFSEYLSLPREDRRSINEELDRCVWTTRLKIWTARNGPTFTCHNWKVRISNDILTMSPSFRWNEMIKKVHPSSAANMPRRRTLSMDWVQRKPRCRESMWLT
jgi:hypothetical protein